MTDGGIRHTCSMPDRYSTRCGGRWEKKRMERRLSQGGLYTRQPSSREVVSLNILVISGLPLSAIFAVRGQPPNDGPLPGRGEHGNMQFLSETLTLRSLNMAKGDRSISRVGIWYTIMVMKITVVYSITVRCRISPARR